MSVSIDVTAVPDVTVRLVVVTAAAEDPPITAPSIVPPLISAVSATRLSIFAVPSMCKSLNSAPVAPKSTSLSVTGTIAPSWKRTCSTEEELTSTKTPIRLLLSLTTTLFRGVTTPGSPIRPITGPSAAVPSCLCPPVLLNTLSIWSNSLLESDASITSPSVYELCLVYPAMLSPCSYSELQLESF